MEHVIRCNSVWPWVEPLANLGDASDGPAPGAAWPKISIVTPNYNYADLIEATIRSIVVQRYPNLEYIVIDDGSTDRSVEVIEQYRAHLACFEHHANQGQYPTINKGFTHATGEIFGWINSDDIYLPWTLRAIGTIFARHPEVQWVIGHPSRIHDGTIHAMGKLTPYPRELIREGFFHGGPGGVGWIQQESCFWRRSLWQKAGPLRTDMRYAADYELWTRFAQHADLYATTTVLGGFSVRGQQNRSIANRDKYLVEVRAAMDRIGAAPGSTQSKIRKSLDTLERVKRIPGLRGTVRRATGLTGFRGPVMKWDFDDGGYRISQKSFF
jgi:hypothetical protein